MNKNNTNDNASIDSIIREAASRRKVLLNFSKTYPAFLILFVSLVISIVIYFYLKDRVDQDNQKAFDKAVNSVMTRLERKHQTT
jgi:sensor domain CHASE-containing protein